MGMWFYSLVAFTMKIANYQGVMGAYQHFLWDNMATFLDSLQEDKKVLAQTFQQEGLSFAKQQIFSAKHMVDVTAKSMATSVMFRCFSWLRTVKRPEHVLKTSHSMALVSLMLKLMTS